MLYDLFTMTVAEMRVWLGTQPADALVLVNPCERQEPFGVTGHAPAGQLPDGRLAVVLTP